MCMLMCMCMLNRRFQLLLDKDMWNKIVKSAKVQNISIGEYVRRAVDKYFEANKESSEKGGMPFKGLFKPR